MNKDQIIERVAEEVGISKSQATKAVKSMFDGIITSLRQG